MLWLEEPGYKTCRQRGGLPAKRNNGKSVVKTAMQCIFRFSCLSQENNLAKKCTFFVAFFKYIFISLEKWNKMDSCRILFVCCQDATMSEIESRLYDQFNITVRDVKVLLADSGECFPNSRRIFHHPFTSKTSQDNQQFCCVI